MTEWKKITIEERLMKDIQSIVEGSNESKSGFATAAIEKEIKRINKERYELDMEKIVNDFRNNAIPYSKKGINNMEDYVNTLISKSEYVKKLESKIDNIEKKAKEEKRFDDMIKRMARKAKKEDPEGYKKVIEDYLEERLTNMRKPKK